MYLLRVMMMIFVNIYFIFYPADLCTALHPMMKILVLVKQREWRTVLQPLVATEEDFVEVSVTEAVEVAAEDAAVVAGAAAVATARRTRSGSP